ncbi:MAG: DUF4294 domain-containing protein [Bacteroidales bacterium]|nr:DUF4294 domain-containing protein [Bacteroidales bacterium]MBQ9255362.1 DUF4294 domain-containing protein [Bacteroidales bacterium]
MKKIFCLSFLMSLALAGFSQTGGGITIFGTIYQGDTIPMSFLDPVLVTSYVTPLSVQEQQKYSKLIRDVRKVYPYAKQAESLLLSYSTLISNAQNESQKDKIRKQAMKDIENKFSGKVKKLKKSQGKILSKLIYRQTGRSSYTLIKNFAGGTKAFFVQTTAKAMGISLDATFDPANNEEDRIIDRIIYCIDNGKI